MWIVASHTSVVSLFTIPISGPPAVYTIPPIPVLRSVTLAAEEVRVLEINGLTVAQRQKIAAIIRVVTVQTPDSHAAVVQFQILMDQEIFSSLEIHGEIFFRTVACAARSNGLGERRQWYGKLSFRF